MTARFATQQKLGTFQVVEQAFRSSGIPETDDLVKIGSLPLRTDWRSLVDRTFEPATACNTAEHVPTFAQAFRTRSKVTTQGDKYSFQRFHVINIDIHGDREPRTVEKGKRNPLEKFFF